MTKSIDINMQAANWTENSGETRREVLGARLIAGVSVPDSPLITESLEYARKLSEPYLFNHAVRSWLFAVKIGHLKRVDWCFRSESLRGQWRRRSGVVHQRTRPLEPPGTAHLGPHRA